MIHRLKTRLALANFKRQYGYEKYDLHTLEWNLIENRRCRRLKRKENQSSSPVSTAKNHRRYYPHYTTSSTLEQQPKMITRTVTNSATSWIFIRTPLSAKRSTSPQVEDEDSFPAAAGGGGSCGTITDEEEDAANLLVMLHNHHHHHRNPMLS